MFSVGNGVIFEDSVIKTQSY